MTDHLIETIRSIDPALRLPPASASVREGTRQMILGTPTSETSGRSHPGPAKAHSRRGLTLALVVALFVIVLPASGAWAYLSYFSDRGTVMDEFHAAQKEMPLPAGAQWVEPDLPKDAVYGSKYGLIAAWGQSMNAWLGEWIAADSAHDRTREQAAVAAVERLLPMAPIHRDGDPEEAGGFVPESITFLQGMIDRAKQGDFSGITEYLQANR